MKNMVTRLSTMLILFVLLLTGCVGDSAKNLTGSAEVAAEQDAIALENEAHPNNFSEAYMGIFALFSGTPYASPIKYVFLLREKTILEGYRNSEYMVSNIVDKRVEEGHLILELPQPESEGNLRQLTIEITHDQADNRHLLFEAGVALYPITLTEFTENGFTIPVGYEHWMEGFKGKGNEEV